MTARRFQRSILAIGAFLFLCASCAEVPERREMSREEQRRLDDSIGKQFAESLESRFEIRSDPDLEIYLRGIALRLMSGSDDLRDQPIGVLAFKEPPVFGSGQQKLFFLGLPGIRLYVSLEYLRAVEFESELAAALGLQLSNVKLRHLARNLEAYAEKDAGKRGVLEEIFPAYKADASISNALGERGVFRFSRQEMAASISEAVELLYRAGYDPRGLAELWKRYQGMAGRTIFETDEIQFYVQQTYRAIARYTPLRNPVLRSAEFLAFKKRIARL